MVQQVPFKLTRLGLARVLADILLAASDTVTAGAVNAVYVGLFTAWPGWSLDLLTGDLTAPAYDGYARQLIVWGTPGTDDQGRPDVLGASMLFSPTGSTTSSTIIGAALYDAITAGNLLGAALLTTPVALGVAADDLTIVPKVAIPAEAAPDWGQFTAIR